MNMKKITAIAATVVMAAGICTGVPVGTENEPIMAITAEAANTINAEVKLYDDKTADITWNEIDNTYYYKVYVGINDVFEVFGMEAETTLSSNDFYFSRLDIG